MLCKVKRFSNSTSASGKVGCCKISATKDKIAEKSPKLLQDLIPEKISLSVVTQILKNLVAESISLRDMRTVIEGLITEAPKTKDPDELTNLIRPRLGRIIMQSLVGIDKTLSVITLDHSLENLLQNTLAQSRKAGELVLDPKVAEALFKSVADEKIAAEEKGLPPVLVVSPALRLWLSKSLKQRVSGLTILAYTEIPEDQNISVLAKISLSAKLEQEEPSQ